MSLIFRNNDVTNTLEYILEYDEMLDLLHLDAYSTANFHVPVLLAAIEQSAASVNKSLTNTNDNDFHDHYARAILADEQFTALMNPNFTVRSFPVKEDIRDALTRAVVSDTDFEILTQHFDRIVDEFAEKPNNYLKEVAYTKIRDEADKLVY